MCADLLGQDGVPSRTLPVPGQQWHWLSPFSGRPCNLTLGSPGQPTTKKLKPREQLAVSMEQCSLAGEASRE